jgi:hypothetical protein
MPRATQEYLAANHTRNTERAMLSAHVATHNGRADGSDIRSQYASDTEYAAALRKINFTSNTGTYVQRYLTTLAVYDRYLRRSIAALDRGVPLAQAFNAEYDERGAAAEAFTSAGAEIRQSLGLAQGTCTFYTP